MKEQQGEYNDFQLSHFVFPVLQFTTGMLNMNTNNMTKLVLAIVEKVQTKDKKTGIKSNTENMIGETSIKISDL